MLYIDSMDCMRWGKGVVRLLVDNMTWHLPRPCVRIVGCKVEVLMARAFAQGYAADRDCGRVKEK